MEKVKFVRRFRTKIALFIIEYIHNFKIGIITIPEVCRTCLTCKYYVSYGALNIGKVCFPIVRAPFLAKKKVPTFFPYGCKKGKQELVVPLHKILLYVKKVEKVRVP